MRSNLCKKTFSVALKTKLQSLQKLQKSKKNCIKNTVHFQRFHVFIAYLSELDYNFADCDTTYGNKTCF